MGKLDVAEACYLSAIKYKGDFPMPLYGLGEVHARRGNDGLAKMAYELAVKAWPKYVVWRRKCRLNTWCRLNTSA